VFSVLAGKTFKLKDTVLAKLKPTGVSFCKALNCVFVKLFLTI